MYKLIMCKTISYRILALLGTLPFTAVATAVEIHVVLSIIYFVHEWVWKKLSVL